MNKTAFIFGYGQIGKRHARVVSALGYDPVIISRHASSQNDFMVQTLKEAYEKFVPDYIVIATETVNHHETLTEIIKKSPQCPILVEKPLFHTNTLSVAENFQNQIGVGYNLRFHHLTQKLKLELQNKTIESLDIHTGQHLSQWRPTRNYRDTSSAKSPGGGVLRDLSHELDLALYFCGPWKQLTGKLSHDQSLGIETESTANIMMECERCPKVTIDLDYLSQKPKRVYKCQTKDTFYELDYISGTFKKNEKVLMITPNLDQSYINMHKFALNTKAKDTLCSYKEGFETLDLIAAVETSNAKQQLVTRM